MLAYLTNLVMFSTDPAAVAALGDAAAQQLLDGMSPSVAALLRAVAPDCRRMVLVCRPVATVIVYSLYIWTIRVLRNLFLRHFIAMGSAFRMT